jgi:hypothetical protein
VIDCNPAPPSPWTAHYSNVYSQYGEDGLLAEIFRRVGTTNKQCFECGAADGKWFSNSRRLIDDGWSAALIEADPSNWPELDKLDARPASTSSTARPSRRAPTRSTRSSRSAASTRRPDLGVIDVDGQDWYLWNGMIKFQPRVMVVEYDPFAPSPGFLPDLGGAGQAGLSAICSIAVTKGYFNVCATQTNLIFCRNDLRDKFHAVDAIKKVPRPWFWAQPAPDGGWGEGRLDDDIAWWGAWGDCGNSLYVHTGCRLGHVEEMVGHYDEKGEVHHKYISQWRKENGHRIESFE